MASLPGRVASVPGRVATVATAMASAPGRIASIAIVMASVPGRVASVATAMASVPARAASVATAIAALPGRATSIATAMASVPRHVATVATAMAALPGRATSIATAQTGCGDFLSCLCPGGTYRESNAQTCTTQAEEASCSSATRALSTCSTLMCNNECSLDGGGGGTGTGSGTSSGTGAGTGSGTGPGSGSGTGTGSGTGGSDAGGVKVSCVTTQGLECTQEIVSPGAVSSFDTQCMTASQGMPGTGCPTAGLTGCCTDPDQTKECTYSPAIALTVMQQCVSPSTWATSL